MSHSIIYWYAQSSDDIPVSLDWLHFSEVQVLDGYHFEKKRKDWLLGRWTAKNAIKIFLSKEYPTLKLKDIEVRRAEDGAPEPLLYGNLLPVHISLSHSHNIGLCSISNENIIHGCDVEYIEPRSDAFISDYLTIQERNILARNTDKIKPLIANIIWSAKESTMKLLRTGLSIDTRKVDIYAIANENLKMWNHIRITYKPEHQKYLGYWKTNKEYVYTIVTEDRSIELMELTHHMQ